jgi:hypothetical protein
MVRRSVRARAYQSAPVSWPTGAAKLVRHHGQREPGSVGHEVARQQVRQPGALELGDGLLDDGVPAVVGFALASGTVRPVVNAWWSQAVNSAGWEPRVGRTRHSAHDEPTRAWRVSLARTMNLTRR